MMGCFALLFLQDISWWIYDIQVSYEFNSRMKQTSIFANTQYHTNTTFNSFAPCHHICITQMGDHYSTWMPFQHQANNINGWIWRCAKSLRAMAYPFLVFWIYMLTVYVEVFFNMFYSIAHMIHSMYSFSCHSTGHYWIIAKFSIALML